jgi:glutaredoxin
MPETSTQEKALVYTHPECGYCPMVKEDLIKAGIDYEEIDLSRKPEAWADVEKVSGGRTVPVLVNIDGSIEVGYHGIGCAF